MDTCPANERMVRQGGLMRCCLATLAATTTESQVGTTLSCQYEGDRKDQMIVATDGVWEWNHP